MKTIGRWLGCMGILLSIPIVSLTRAQSLPCTPYSSKLGCIDPTLDPSHNGELPVPCLKSTKTRGSCIKIRIVGCPSITGGTLNSITPEIKIGEPTFGRVELGTVVFFSGFGGVGDWEDVVSPALPQTAATVGTPAPDVINALRDAGYRTVQVGWEYIWWDVDFNLETTPPSTVFQEGLVRLACRTATVLQGCVPSVVEKRLALPLA